MHSGRETGGRFLRLHTHEGGRLIRTRTVHLRLLGFHFLSVADDIGSAARLFMIVFLLLVLSSFIVARVIT